MLVGPSKILVLTTILVFADELKHIADADKEDNQNIHLMSHDEKQDDHYFLSSIIYYSPEKWTIWLNDEKIQQSQAEQLGIKISVKCQLVEIEEGDKKYTLLPNQTFEKSSKKIFNGDKRIKQKKDAKNDFQENVIFEQVNPLTP